MNRVLLAALTCLVSRELDAQQQADPAYRYVTSTPAFASGRGPRVCIDAAHHNHQTIHPGAFDPFAALVRGDGFQVRETNQRFSAEVLRDCDVLVVPNANADAEPQYWKPRVQALTSEETLALERWIRAGGGLLLIADHTPGPGAVAELGQLLGIIVLDGLARLRADSLTDVFARSRGELGDHKIVRGIDSVATFHGHAFFASRDWSPLLRFGPASTSYVPFAHLQRAEWPVFALDGWLHAAARELGSGRVVWLSEVSTCTALRGPMGMNHSSAGENARFCLNSVRWLAGERSGR